MSARIAYSRLSREARELIRWSSPSATIAGYVRHWFPDGQWGGDRCGCVDDRCIGYHHDETAQCGCLEWWLDEYLDSARDAHMQGTS